MKKWLMISLTLLVSITLVACNSDDNTVTLQTEQNGVIMKIAYKGDGDEVIEQTADNVMPYEALNVTTKEEAQKILAPVVGEYAKVKGITHNMDYQDDKVVESLKIDYEIADPEEVSQLVGTTFEGDISEGISLKKSVEALQAQGFEIVE